MLTTLRRKWHLTCGGKNEPHDSEYLTGSRRGWKEVARHRPSCKGTVRSKATPVRRSQVKETKVACVQQVGMWKGVQHISHQGCANGKLERAIPAHLSEWLHQKWWHHWCWGGLGAAGSIVDHWRVCKWHHHSGHRLAGSPVAAFKWPRNCTPGRFSQRKETKPRHDSLKGFDLSLPKFGRHADDLLWVND